MSKVSNLIISIMKEIEAGNMSFQQIANKFDIPLHFVDDVWIEMMNYPQDACDDSMDGDNASALASAGWGTDEDYGFYDGE